MSRPICLIVNPSAGGGKSRRLAPVVHEALVSHGLEVRRTETRDLAHARTLALEATRAGETIVSLSGDGLVGEIADVLRDEPGSILGILPGGRGNDLARVLGIPQDARAACAVIAAGHTRQIDLGIVTKSGSGSSRAFVGIASAGFDSVANRIANEAPAWLGGLVYAYGALRALLAWRPACFEIELRPSGERFSFSGYSIAAANSRAYGGGMLAAPDAMLDDGLLEIVVIEEVGRWRFLANLPRVFKGTHVELPSVRVLRAAEVEVSSDRPFEMYADGDPIGALPLRVSARRGAVRMLVPAGGSDALSPLPAVVPPDVEQASA